MGITPTEFEQMRELLREHDKKNLGQEIDLSKPIIVPYKYQPFPKMVYKIEECLPSRMVQKDSVLPGSKPTIEAVPPKFATRTVNSQDELDAALAQGYSATPPVWEDAVPDTIAEEVIVSAPRRRGRPAKVV